MVVNTDGLVSVVKSLEIEGVEYKQILDACSTHQCIYALLVFCHDGFLETLFLIFTFAVAIQLFEIVLFVFNNHTTSIFGYKCR